MSLALGLAELLHQRRNLNNPSEHSTSARRLPFPPGAAFHSSPASGSAPRPDSLLLPRPSSTLPFRSAPPLASRGARSGAVPSASPPGRATWAVKLRRCAGRASLVAPISPWREAGPPEPARPRGRRCRDRPRARAPAPVSAFGVRCAAAGRPELSAPLRRGSGALHVTSDTAYPPVSDSSCLVSPLIIFSSAIRPEYRPHVVSSKTVQLRDRSGDRAAR